MRHPNEAHSDDARLAFALAAALLLAAIARRFVADRDPPAATTFARHLVDVNSASTGEIEALPSVGPVLAGRIVASRDARPYSSPEDLGRVPGVGPTTIERLRAFVRCGRR